MSSLDWQQFQARLQKLISVFHAVATQGQAPASPPASPVIEAPQESAATEERTAVQPRAHLPTVLDQVGIKLDDQPTRAQMVSALVGVIDACRRVKTN